MESWQYQYDSMLANPPEPLESRCKCVRCKEELYPDDAYYLLEDDIYCGFCAEKWLGEQREVVTREMCYGG